MLLISFVAQLSFPVFGSIGIGIPFRRISRNMVLRLNTS